MSTVTDYFKRKIIKILMIIPMYSCSREAEVVAEGDATEEDLTPPITQPTRELMEMVTRRKRRSTDDVVTPTLILTTGELTILF